MFGEREILATTVVNCDLSRIDAATTPQTQLLEASHLPYILVVDILAGHNVIESHHEGSPCMLLLTRRRDHPILKYNFAL
jgi:hypothetical protein